MRVDRLENMADFSACDYSKALNLAERLVSSGEPNLLWDEISDLSRAEAKALDHIAFKCAVCSLWFRQADNATPGAAQWQCRECA